MYNVYENMIELAFNENCMNQESDIQSCTRMLNDIKILIFNKYEIVHTINSNRNKYINEDFTQQDFLNILEMVKFVEDKWKITEKEIQNQKDIIRGQIWEYFIAKQEEMRKSSLYDPNDKDIGMMNEIGGEDKFFAKKLMGEIKNGFGSFKNEYGEFLKNKGIVDPNYHQKDLDFEKQFPTQEEQMVDRSTNTNKNISKKSEIQSKQEIKKKVVF